MANVLQPYYLLQSAFTGGEISSEVSNRVDLDKYQYSVLRAKNCLVRPYGPIYRRPGMKYVARTKTADKKSVLLTFNGEEGNDYLLEIGEKYIRAYKDGKYLGVEMVTPFLERDLPKLRFTQSADTLFVASGEYPVKKVVRYADNDWKFSDFDISDIYFDDNLQADIVASALYTTPGNYRWTVPKDGRYIIEVAGAGGGGSGSARKAGDKQSSGGNGGRGGFYSFEMDLTEGTTYSISVGAGGKGGAVHNGAGLGNPGGNGGDTTAFDKVAKGGGGGTPANSVNYGAYDGSDGTNYGNGGIGGSAGKAYDDAHPSGTDGANGWVTIVYKDNPTVKPSKVNGTIEITSNSDIFTEKHVGGQIRMIHEVPSVSVELSNAGTTAMLKIGEEWKVISGGSWNGKLTIEKSEDGKTWKEFRKYSSTKNFNVSESGAVSDVIYLRMTAEISSGDFTATLTAMPYKKEGTAKITEFKNSKVVSAMVQKDFGSTDETSNYAFGVWNEEYGYPRTVCFFQDRLCFGGSKKQPYMVWMSRTGDYGNFSVEKASGTITDDSAVAVAFVSRKQFKILHMVAGTDLIILTAGNEWTISGSETVTPTKCVPKMQTTRGCNECEPLMIGGRIVFVQGRGSTVRDMGYSFETDSYGGNDLTLLAKHLITGVDIVDSDYKQEPDSTIYFVRSDGVMICLAYIIEQKVYAWSTVETQGTIEAVATVQEDDEDVVYLIVKREINGTVVRSIEYICNNSSTSNVPENYIMLDSAMILTQDDATRIVRPTSFIVPELAGTVCDVIADGRAYRNINVSENGLFTLPTAAKKAVIGLPYESVIELPNVEIRTGDGTMQGRFKQVSSCIVRLKNSLGGTAGCSTDTMDQLQYDELSAVKDIRLFSGDKKITLPIGGFNNDGRIVIQSDEPYPLNVLAIVREVTFGG